MVSYKNSNSTLIVDKRRPKQVLPQSRNDFQISLEAEQRHHEDHVSCFSPISTFKLQRGTPAETHEIR